jgi:hypothetical protein
MRSAFRQLFFLGAFIVPLFFCVRSTNAQFTSEKEKSTWSIGAEGGWMWHQQMGSFIDCTCRDLEFQNGKGKAPTISVFTEFKINNFFAIGGSFGYNSRIITVSQDDSTDATIGYSDGKVRHGTFSVLRTDEVSTTYLSIDAYLKFSPFGYGLFFLLAPEIEKLQSSNLTDKVKLQNNPDSLRDLRFQNGTNEETLANGAIPNVNKLRIALLLAAGYEIPLFNRFSLMPQIKYDYPITKIAEDSKTSSNWKIASWDLSLAFKYDLE